MLTMKKSKKRKKYKKNKPKRNFIRTKVYPFTNVITTTILRCDGIFVLWKKKKNIYTCRVVLLALSSKHILQCTMRVCLCLSSGNIYNHLQFNILSQTIEKKPNICRREKVTHIHRAHSIINFTICNMDDASSRSLCALCTHSWSKTCRWNISYFFLCWP